MLCLFLSFVILVQFFSNRPNHSLCAVSKDKKKEKKGKSYAQRQW